MKVIPETGAAPILRGNMETVNMGISDHPEDQLMILNVLSNTLYTDKIAAVLREYGCNAFDANVEAGRGEKPIEVRLPNKLDPTVSIRDFGLGMTERQILQTFCKLGRSTKRSSNAFTGMLGIGSKAGFAYGDSFTVTSYENGQKTVYACTRLQGVPTLSKMHQEATDAPDGVEVKVPVRQADIAEFVAKAERVYRYFKVRPIFHGAKIAFDLHPAKFKGTNWRFTGSGSSVAVMGNVGYDLTVDGLGVASADTQYGSKVWTLIKAGIEVDFNIGDLEIAANREGLQYRDHTKKQIVDICKGIVAEIGKVFTDKIKTAKNLWEATNLYAELFDNRGAQKVYTDYNINTIVSGTVTWNGKKIGDSRICLGNKENDPDVKVMRFSKDSYCSKIRRYDDVDRVHVKNCLLVLNDSATKANSPARIAGAFEQDPTLANVVVFAFKTPAAEKKFWAARELDGAPTKNLMSIAPAATVPTGLGPTGGPSAHRAKHQASAFVLDENPSRVRTYGVRSAEWLKTTVNTQKDTGAYVIVDNFYVQPPTPTARLSAGYDGVTLRAQVKLMRDAGLLVGQKIFGFKKDRAAKLGPNWFPLATWLTTHLKGLVADAKFAQGLADYIEAQSQEWHWKEETRTDYAAGSLFREFLDDIYRMRNPKSNKELFAFIERNAGLPWVSTPTLPKASIDLADKQAKVLAKYPTLSIVPLHESRNMPPKQRAIVADYVQLIEKN